MSPRPARAICASCKQTLPRAASHRCPFCRAPMHLGVFAVDAICHNCNSPIPRAHRGKCPCTANLPAARADTPALDRRNP